MFGGGVKASTEITKTVEVLENDTGTEQEETKEPERPNEKYKRASNVELPPDFKVVTEEQLETIPNLGRLVNARATILRGIGVQKIAEVIWGNYRNVNGIVSIDAYIVTPKSKDVLVSLMYISFSQSPEWNVSFVKDAANGHYYYIPNELKETEDLYDYTTGKLISQKTKSHEDIQKEIDESVSKITEEFEDNLEKIKDKYLENDEVEENTKNTESKVWNVIELKIGDELIMDSTVSEMISGYDYIKDIHIEVDESKKKIDIVVQVPSSTDIDTAKMAGEDVARYLAAQASWATNSHREYKSPGIDYLGGLYDRYDLLIYVDDGLKNFNLYGGKVTSAKNIRW